MSGDVSSVAESRSHLFNGERVLVSDGPHRFPGGDGSDKGGDIDPGSSDARLAEPDVGVHRDARESKQRQNRERAYGWTVPSIRGDAEWNVLAEGVEGRAPVDAEKLAAVQHSRRPSK